MNLLLPYSLWEHRPYLDRIYGYTFFFAALQLVKEEGEGRYGPFYVTQELVYNVVEQMQEAACKLKSGTK